MNNNMSYGEKSIEKRRKQEAKRHKILGSIALVVAINVALVSAYLHGGVDAVLAAVKKNKSEDEESAIALMTTSARVTGDGTSEGNDFSEISFLSSKEQEELLRRINDGYQDKCTFEKECSAADIVNTIMSNSADFASNHPGYLSLFDYEGLASYILTNDIDIDDFDTAMKAMTTGVIFVVKDACAKYDDDVIGSKSDIHNLMDVKLVLDVEGKNQVDDVNCIAIDYKGITSQIEDNQQKSVVYNSVFIESMISKLTRIIQRDCPEYGAESKMLTYDSGVVPFILDTSTISVIPNYYGITLSNNFDKTLLFERNAEAKLLLLTLFDRDKDISWYYNAINKNDLASFCEYFGANSSEDQLRLFNLIASYDAVYMRNSYYKKVRNMLDLTDYTSYAKEKLAQRVEDKIDFSNDATILGIAVDKMITDANSHADLSMIDYFDLFDFVSSVAFADTYSSDSTMSFDVSDTLIAKYFELKDKFIKSMAVRYDCSLEDALNAYENNRQNSLFFSSLAYKSGSVYYDSSVSLDDYPFLADQYSSSKGVCDDLLKVFGNLDDIARLCPNFYKGVPENVLESGKKLNKDLN